MPEASASTLLVTRNLPPLRGGMERLNLHLASALAEAGSVAVCGPEGCGTYLPKGVESVEVRPRPLPWFLFLALAKALLLAWRRAPQHVLAGSGLTAPIAWLIARISRAHLVVYVHGLDLVAPSKLYQSCWLPFIRRADLVIANSRNTQALAESRGVSRRVIAVLHPGTHLPMHDGAARTRFRARLGLGDAPLLLAVGRLTPRKGLAEFVRETLPALVMHHPDARLLIIGEDATDAVRAIRRSERARIMQAAEEAGVTQAVRWLPPCDDATLADAYQSADVHVFPVRDIPGDVEGFGMVAIEAAAHGLPTVAFNVGGVADAVIDGRSGALVTAGDYRGFAAATEALLPLRPERREECRRAAATFGWDAFGDRLRKLLIDLQKPAS